MKGAVKRLVTGGLLAEVSNGETQPERRMDWVVKAKWSEVVASRKTMKEVKRLELTGVHFDN